MKENYVTQPMTIHIL